MARLLEAQGAGEFAVRITGGLDAPSAGASGFAWLEPVRGFEASAAPGKADAGPISQNPGAGGDTVPGNTSTTFTLDIGDGESGFVNTAGDKDWYAVELTAGTWYQLALRGSGADPLSDAFLEIRDEAGGLLGSDDDSGAGLNSALTFIPEETGTYYVSAGGFGSSDGEYRLSAKETAAPDVLDSIDWGTTVSSNTVKVYFAQSGETYDGETSLGWNAYEIQQAMLAFQQFSNVTNLTFQQSTNEASADFHLVTNNAGGYLGYFNPPGTTNEGVGVFSRPGTGWEEGGEGGLDQGGYGFVTLIHEFGHGVGMAHPHDDGGSSTVMVGVTSAFDSYGLYDLNQGVYTTMSYNDAWPVGPDGWSAADGYGWQGTLMALDIALLQQKYGANTSYRTGNDVYELADANAPGTMFACIWDAEGADWMSYSGTAAAVLDLRAATIDYSPTGGGAISYVAGIIGGFTIDQGAVIEHALGGSGDDQITGNDTANKLMGGDGDDVINGGHGLDKLTGGDGGDTFVFAVLEGAKDKILDLTDDDVINLKLIDADTTLAGDQKFELVDAFTNHAGQAVLDYSAAKDKTVLKLDVDGDGASDMRVTMAGDHSGFLDFIL